MDIDTEIIAKDFPDPTPEQVEEALNKMSLSWRYGLHSVCETQAGRFITRIGVPKTGPELVQFARFTLLGALARMLATDGVVLQGDAAITDEELAAIAKAEEMFNQQGAPGYTPIQTHPTGGTYL